MDVFSGKGCGGRCDTIFGKSKYNKSIIDFHGIPPRPSFLSLKKVHKNITLEKQTSCNVVMSTKVYDVAHERRSANYKPNIWSFDFIQSLSSQYIDVAYKTWVEKLKEEFMYSLSEETSELSKLHVIDSILKLGLSSFFTDFIKDTLESISSNMNKTTSSKESMGILKVALSFRLLRQYGYDVSPDVFVDFIDEMVPLEGKVGLDLIRGSLALFEASHLAMEGEEILVKAKALSYQNLIDNREYLDDNLGQQVSHALKGSGVVWFDAIHQINAYEQENEDENKILVELAKLNFNITQAMLIEELKELSRWWNNPRLIESIRFSRDRLVESFLWTIGITFEPDYALLRKCLTKIATFILVIDDLYDIYGSFEELKHFTRTVERWDSQEMQQLPECMKICFETLRTTTAEIANEIEKEKGFDDISFHLYTAVELERGDPPSSVLCYMVEANVTEEMARVHVKKTISDTWKKINEELLSASPNQQACVNLIINMARVSQFIYREGDGFSVPNKETRKLIKGLLVAPIELSMDYFD